MLTVKILQNNGKNFNNPTLFNINKIHRRLHKKVYFLKKIHYGVIVIQYHVKYLLLVLIDLPATLPDESKS